MKSLNTLIYLCIFLIIVFSSTTFSQVQSIPPADSVMIPRVQISLKDGTILKGKILSSTLFIHTINTDNLGVLQVNIENVLSITLLDEANETSDKFDDFSIKPTSYFISSSAYNLAKGENRYTNSIFLINDFAFGLSNKFSVSVSPVILPIPFFGVFFGCAVGGKFTQPIGRKLNIGASFYLGAGSGTTNTVQMGSAFATYGNPNSNLTMGFSSTFVGNGDHKNFAQLSGMHRLTKRVALIAESILFTKKETNFYYYGNGNYTTTDNTTVSAVIFLGAKIFYKKSFLDFGILNGSNINNSERSNTTAYIKFTTLMGSSRKK
ncbi:hypothetical protein VB264_05565 [Arcicella aquatica]|uniref:Outer membrane beta-barrel porin/alpha-amylase n=1 Tax=Arcicella aquatica TaxID=217141 RepID=A0ABU5QJK2_9BACT|nr:hypothetical protein [Arcicella aquatica]MEA5257246.1 hypothetical protein [Arcicella aquatica]